MSGEGFFEGIGKVFTSGRGELPVQALDLNFWWALELSFYFTDLSWFLNNSVPGKS